MDSTENFIVFRLYNSYSMIKNSITTDVRDIQRSITSINPVFSVKIRYYEKLLNYL